MWHAKPEADERGGDVRNSNHPEDEQQPTTYRSYMRMVMGCVLVLYGVFNTVIFIKMTPVYTATECATEGAVLEKFTVGHNIKVGLRIEVLCVNPNNYDVQVMASHSGQVFLGRDRQFYVGNLSLAVGSSLPAKGSGTIAARTDAVLSPRTSASLLPHLLTDRELPIFVELRFDVGVGVTLGSRKLGIVAPFAKKCGMYLVGIFINTENRLGPMICRDSFEALEGHIPLVDKAIPGTMSFSAAQMDPERVHLGEAAKNISTLGMGGWAYLYGFLLIYRSLLGAPDTPESEETGNSCCSGRGCSEDGGTRWLKLPHSAWSWRGEPREPPEPPPPSGIGGVLNMIRCGCCRSAAMERDAPPPKTQRHSFPYMRASS